MARQRASSQAPRACVPRERGDGPSPSRLSPANAQCSPRARGWPERIVTALAKGLVFPASAGMARPSSHDYRRIPRVPRERGDGPAIGYGGNSAFLCSPRARGWPGTEADVESNAEVFPASAGMARLPRRICSGRRRVPRERGDGPSHASDLYAAQRCSPRARGWPGLAVIVDRALGVFPASAGMARRGIANTGAGRRVPRERGDGPDDDGEERAVSACSPRARGWPAVVVTLLDRLGVFPASAGMARWRPSSRSLRTCVPRERGDGPRHRSPKRGCDRCSPRARGWPVRQLQFNADCDVFPASAGMARSTGDYGAASSSVPRERGDGPQLHRARLAHGECSPRARGWPGAMNTLAAYVGVFPASAGMAR